MVFRNPIAPMAIAFSAKLPNVSAPSSRMWPR
jgi:hypothetical protein